MRALWFRGKKKKRERARERKREGKGEILLYRKMPAIKSRRRGFPGGARVENLPANAGDTGSIPGRGRSHMPQSN